MPGNPFRFNMMPGGSGFHSCPAHCFRHCGRHPEIHGARENIFRFQFITHQTGNCLGGRNVHGIINPLCTYVQSTSKDARKCQAVVHLIGEIRSSGSDHYSPCLFGDVRMDFWNRIEYNILEILQLIKIIGSQLYESVEITL